MTDKRTVLKYMEGFRRSDHEMILDCLTDDVVWKMPGVYTHTGKKEFERKLKLTILKEVRPFR